MNTLDPKQISSFSIERTCRELARLTQALSTKEVQQQIQWLKERLKQKGFENVERIAE